MAPTSMSWVAGIPCEAITLATSLKWGILFPPAAIRKMVLIRIRPSTARIPRTAYGIAASFSFSRHSGQIEQQHFRRFPRPDRQAGLRLDRRAITGRERVPLQGDAPAEHLQPGASPLRERVSHLVSRLERGEVQRGVLVDRQRAVSPVGRDDHPEPSPTLVDPEGTLLVPRLQPFSFGQEPDLVEVHRNGRRAVEFAVTDPR